MRKVVWTFALFALLFSARAQATLHDRLNGLIYDDVLNITWTQDANLCVALNNCIPGPGSSMTWGNANFVWAANLVYGGFSDWRLPNMDVNGDGTVVSCTTNADCPDNEYGHMYYQNLNGVSGQNKTGNQVGDGGVTLNNIQSFYWSGTDFKPNPVFVWEFFFESGVQVPVGLNTFDAAWAVRPGDVAIVPVASVSEPGSMVLLGLGLLVFGRYMLRRQRNKRNSKVS